MLQHTWRRRITSLKLYSHCSHTLCTCQQGCCPWQPLTFSPLLSFFLSFAQTLLFSLGAYLQARMVPQLQLFYNNDGCQLHLFFNNGGCQPLTCVEVAHGWCSSSSSCCICQWTVPSINGCCTLMVSIYDVGRLLPLFCLFNKKGFFFFDQGK